MFLTFAHMKQLIFLLLTAVGFAASADAQDFNEHFSDSTLRIDYIFSGSASEQHIAVDELCLEPRWYGKRLRMAELPLEGNGQIIVKSHATGKTLDKNSFSTLFQEWLTSDEAKTISKSFENVFLVPFPKQEVDITINLFNTRRKVALTFTHHVNPNDILIRRTGFSGVMPYKTMLAAEDTSRCIHIAYLAEGYTKEQMPTFLKDVETAMSALFSHEPFKSLKGRFNIVAVMAESAEDGTSEPGKNIWRRTALGSHFDTFYSERYLTTLHLKQMHELLAGTPYEHIIVLVNSPRYGGGGILNSYTLSTIHHAKSLPVVVHEFGHSFGGLADEYAYEEEAIPMYPADIEPWEPNITTQADFASKWQDMVGNVSGVGLYQGAGYDTKNVYRACPDCRMRTNENPDFCPVCRRAITRLIDFYTK